MHYACLIITKEFPTDDILEQILAPYSDNAVYSQPEDTRIYPPIMWDWWKVGGRYNGQFKLAIKENDEKYRWKYVAKEPRIGRLFRSQLLEDMREFAVKAGKSVWFREEDYFRSMGSFDGFIHVDGAAVSDILNFGDVMCYYCIDADGNAFGRSSWNGEEWKNDDEFEAKLKNVIENSESYYACIVDLHD